MMKSQLISILTVLVFAGCKSKTPEEQKPLERPNIIWIIVEDMSSNFDYQGEQLVKTPNINQLADEGVVFSNAYVTAPVCSASRSALITGMYQTSIGAQNHRSSKGELQIYLPEGIETVPEIFRKAGYYTCKGTERPGQKGKEDYNFNYDSKNLYDASDWSKRAEGQPFFAQIQLRGGKLRNVPSWQEEVVAGLDSSLLVSPYDVTLPPYYPSVAAFRKDWAEYLTDIEYTDKEVGGILERLKKDNLMENTVVFFITDRGISQARGKQFLYDEGTKIPFVVWAPKLFQHKVVDDLVNHIDISATSLQLAGIEIPDYMESNPLLGEKYEPRDYIVSARDRCDETVDHIRSVRKGDFKYIKNYLPKPPYLQPNAYKDHKPWMHILREMEKEGTLNNIQKLITAKTRPPEELYDLSKDPFEINNLASHSKYANKLADLRKILQYWVKETGDKGQYPEPEKMYDSDMEAYLNSILRYKEYDEAHIIEANIATMKKWKAEGK